MRFCLFLLAAGSLAAAEPARIFYTSVAVKASLFISKADGTEERPLFGSSSSDYNPAWSPDGQWVAFTSERNGSADLYRVKPDGTALERLTDNPAYDDQAAFSPDSSQIVFVTSRANGHANLWTLDLGTHKAKALTSGMGGDFRPSWSPDGNWIAFSSDRGSTLPMGKGRWEHLQIADIYLIHPDGSGVKRLTEHGNFCGSPKWTRDSRRVIAYCMSAEETLTYRNPPSPGANTRLVSIEIASGKTDDVSATSGVKYAPNVLASGEIAYVTRKDQRNSSILYAQGKPGPKGGLLMSPSWSPDGEHVVFHRFNGGPDSGAKLWSRNPKYELHWAAVLPVFDPSGDHYAASLGPDLAIFDTGGKDGRKVYHVERGFVAGTSWSPLGDSILFGIGAFNAFRFQGDFSNGRLDGGAQIAMIKPDGTGFREVTSGGNNNGFPSFAPDGKRFVYRTAGPEGQGLRIMDLETKKLTTLTTEYDNFPLWSPRGDLIAFVRQIEGDYEIFTIHPDGTSTKRLTFSPGNDAHGAWSPDGEWLLFSSSRMGFKDEAIYTGAPQPYGELFVMRYDGTHVEQLTDNQWEDAGPAWQPVSKPARKLLHETQERR
jgi:TolB protein